MVETEEMRLDLQHDSDFKLAVRHILIRMGEDPDREGLERTPVRVAKAFEEWFGGYKIKPEQVLDRTFPSEGYDDIIAVTEIEFDSFCEHHMTPIRGKAHIFYVPSERITGLDKFVKLVYMYAKRLQTQEVMTQQIGDAIKNILSPFGVYVYVEAKHNCVGTRGVKNKSTTMVTTYRAGLFISDFEMETKALEMIKLTKMGGL